MAANQSRRSFFKKSAVAGTAAGAAMLANSLNGLAEAVDRTPQSSNPSALRITDVRCGQIRGGHSLFVKIYTNQDILVVLGEIYNSST